jgi:hypothetical protein
MPFGVASAGLDGEGPSLSDLRFLGWPSLEDILTACSMQP